MIFRSKLAVGAGLVVTAAVLLQPHAYGQPSFDCRRNTHSDERTICASSLLSQLDRQLSDVFLAVRDGLDAQGQINLRDAQCAWIKQRAACGADATCIASVYRLRIKQLRLLSTTSAPSTPTASMEGKPARSATPDQIEAVKPNDAWKPTTTPVVRPSTQEEIIVLQCDGGIVCFVRVRNGVENCKGSDGSPEAKREYYVVNFAKQTVTFNGGNGLVMPVKITDDSIKGSKVILGDQYESVDISRRSGQISTETSAPLTRYPERVVIFFKGVCKVAPKKAF